MAGLLGLRQIATASVAAVNTPSPQATWDNQTWINQTVAPYATNLNGINVNLDLEFNHLLWWFLGVLGMLILVLRVWERIYKHFRHLTTMTITGVNQHYWARNHGSWWKIKKYLLYAPLGKKRHNQEYRITPAVNMGTLPSRLHAIILVSYLVGNIAFCVLLDYSDPNKYALVAELRGRSGVLAIANMVALVLFAGRNNPLIGLLQISFDTYNLFHRWIGRIVVLESLIHTLAWAYVKHAATGWPGVNHMLLHDPFIQAGAAGTIPMVLLFCLSPSPLRHAFYETFLNVHDILALVAVVGVYVHCVVAELSQLVYIQIVVVIWISDRIFRFGRILYYNWSFKGWTTASIEAMPGDATRVTLYLPKYAAIAAGTHAYLRFGSISPWESHPFSIAWVEHHLKDGETEEILESDTDEKDLNEKVMNEKITEKDVEAQAPLKKRFNSSQWTTTVSFVIGAQSGMTRKLNNLAKSHSGHGNRLLTMKAAFEGPYAGQHSLKSYGHSVLFAGSSGITHQLFYVRKLLEDYNEQTVATRKVTLIWTIREAEHLEWVRPWMNEILHMPNRRDVLVIKIYITRPVDSSKVVNASQSVQMHCGRPDIDKILKHEIANQVGAMCVTVCGPGGLQDNVREAVRKYQEHGHMDYIEESFTW